MSWSYANMQTLCTFGGGGGAAWTPALPVTGDNVLPSLWLQADAITGLNDGAAVATWSGSVGGVNATQATPTKQPTYQTNELNGKPVVRFDGGDVLITPAVNLNSAGVTIFAVFNAASGNDQAIVDFSINPVTVLTGLSFFRGSLNNPTAFYKGDVGFSNFVSSSTVTTGFAYTSAVYNKALATNESVVWVNGVAGGSRDYNTNNTNVFGNQAFYIGGRGTTPTLPLTGDIAEILVYPVALSDTGRQQVEAYLQAKYFT